VGVSANRLQTVHRKAQGSPTKAGSSGPLKAEPRAPTLLAACSFNQDKDIAGFNSCA
jgi:hypothetical protein